MADTKASRKLVTLDQDTVRRLDDYRFGNRIGHESEALRRLIELALDQVEAAQGPQGAPIGR